MAGEFAIIKPKKQQVTLINKRILLVVSGGIAAYKAAELVRLLRKQGSEVRVVMTHAAQQFVTPLTFQALSGHQVYTELVAAGQEQAMDHIHLARWADNLVVAPATANLLAKFGHGLADDLASTLYLAAACPVIVAPAMNQAMWHKPVTQENIAKLKQHGVQFIGPVAGEQACGEQGLGRMAEPEAICRYLFGNDRRQLLQGLNVSISAGPTREPIDPVRFISNRSSGKMGYALAQVARQMGANVTLISGPVSLSAPPGVKLLQVETTQQMYEAIMAGIAAADIYIGTAAVVDYRAALPESHKIKKQADQAIISLQKNIDIIAAVASLPNKPFTVGFAAETQGLEEYALDKLNRKNLDMIAANWVGNETEGGFDSDQNALQVFWHGGRQTLDMTSKLQLAEQLLVLVAQRFADKSATN
ncbi:bifunctional phosphopantothenoylcysteine decarboxylase/phosphopantothenate--cysteine ligase CoaBC [Methylomonas paludis]|uniref:Coenzyme A biosynthesis bifunctional protein CoaBC n=1 Tax=Methylomonas paludis TaxID=1173101 RepID=A0A975R931_9GAMM|nr:bifunctional phosphopantothenoylcysteine decarboxylase/phosphopantothenate--cysteine ligase CoaBC [Methylomonas paludis]QWF70652.1 bifunctional phosphopantothenoylcysteine decarboxylase/phosphopantothenate--cysteine ligase CoaBC [Methylomonas paludis]